jgi:hypothetical protein
MNPNNFKMSKEVFDEMLLKQSPNTNYATEYHGYRYKGESPGEQCETELRHLYTTLLSKPLKKIQVAMLSAVGEECYKEKHLSESMPNVEQINICKNEVRTRFMGKFDANVDKHRDTELYKL